MINQVNLYGKLNGKGVSMATTQNGALKLYFEVAVRRPGYAPKKRDDKGRLMPDFVPVVVAGKQAETVLPWLQPWMGTNGNTPPLPFITVYGMWTTHTTDNGRIHHECLAQTVLIHGNGNENIGESAE